MYPKNPRPSGVTLPPSTAGNTAGTRVHNMRVATGSETGLELPATGSIPPTSPQQKISSGVTRICESIRKSFSGSNYRDSWSTQHISELEEQVRTLVAEKHKMQMKLDEVTEKCTRLESLCGMDAGDRDLSSFQQHIQASRSIYAKANPRVRKLDSGNVAGINRVAVNSPSQMKRSTASTSSIKSTQVGSSTNGHNTSKINAVKRKRAEAAAKGEPESTASTKDDKGSERDEDKSSNENATKSSAQGMSDTPRGIHKSFKQVVAKAMANARAVRDGDMLMLGKVHLENRFMALKESIREQGRKKSASTEEKLLARCARFVFERSAEETEALELVLLENVLFADLVPTSLQYAVSMFFQVVVKKDDVLIKQGERGDMFYICQSGRLSCYVKGIEASVFDVLPGCGVGELALMYNDIRKATVICEESSVLWAVDRPTFQKIVTANERLKNIHAKQYKLMHLPHVLKHHVENQRLEGLSAAQLDRKMREMKALHEASGPASGFNPYAAPQLLGNQETRKTQRKRQGIGGSTFSRRGSLVNGGYSSTCSSPISKRYGNITAGSASVQASPKARPTKSRIKEEAGTRGPSPVLSQRALVEVKESPEGT